MAKRRKLSDDDILRIVADERRVSIGFEYDHKLLAERETALKYYRGDMFDIPALPNRSKAVSSDVADAIHTALPDLMEVFFGGDDVATFQPIGPQDEEQSKMETEYVKHTVFDANEGFQTFYTFIQDALLTKIGVVMVDWEEREVVDEQEFAVPPEQFQVMAAQLQAQGYELAEVEPDEDNEPGHEGFIEFCARKRQTLGNVKIRPVPPEDFSFARDTTSVRTSTYVNMRARPRAQQLVEEGYDPDLIDRLHDYGMPSQQDVIQQARDTANESTFRPPGSTRDLRTVEVLTHYIRVDRNGDGKLELLKVVTGNNEAVLLDIEEVDFIPFAVITPYPVSHRLLGQSLADLVIEIQRIKTALLRMLLDSGYFALNQRVEVATSSSNEWTISDLLRNEPGSPIRSKDGNAIKPIQAGGITYDIPGAMEYVNTMAEQRTGIVRNAQGLNPDTLHDTAAGAQALVAAAQKRVRMIARIFAETGVKDLFLHVHHMLRKYGDDMQSFVGGQWQNVNPKTWPRREALKIEIGVGSGGREHDILAGNALGQMLAQAIQAQGGIDGPLTNSEGLHKFAVRQTERLGFKDGEQYWTDPKTYQPPPPSPPPEVVKAQIDGQVKQQQAQQQAQLDAGKLQLEHGLKRDQMEAELQLKREQIAAELELKREQLAAELQMKHQLGLIQAASHHEVQSAKVASSVKPGGEPG